MVQFPTMQQTVPVQVPIQTGNGQTIYQTVHVPLQAFAGQMPGLCQPQMQIFPQIAQVSLDEYLRFERCFHDYFYFRFEIGCEHYHTKWSDSASAIGTNEPITR